MGAQALLLGAKRGCGSSLPPLGDEHKDDDGDIIFKMRRTDDARKGWGSSLISWRWLLYLMKMKTTMMILYLR